jgi:hypothetical protein
MRVRWTELEEVPMDEHGRTEGPIVEVRSTATGNVCQVDKTSAGGEILTIWITPR